MAWRGLCLAQRQAQTMKTGIDGLKQLLAF